MIKLLVVDDESATRKGLIRHIPWEDLGVHLVEEAKDGFDALEIAGRFRPDIILSDIRMPGMDGIELAGRIRESLPGCRIIFLSGYSDKEYLKAAINLSAVSYVEKPVNPPEVKEAVRRAVSRCIEAEAQKLAEANINNLLSENLPYLKQKIINGLIHEKADPEECLKDLALTGVPFLYKECFKVMLIKLRTGAGANQEGHGSGRELLDIVDEDLAGVKHLSAFKDSRHIIVVLSPGIKGDRGFLHKSFDSIKDHAEKRGMGGIKLFCAVGRDVCGMDRIFESYRTAVLALQKLFIYGYGNIAFYEREPGSPYLLDENARSGFLRCLSEQKREEALALIEKQCREIRRQDAALVNCVKDHFFRLAFELFKEAERRGVHINEAGNNGEKYLWDLISGFETLQEIREYLMDKTTLVFNGIEELESSNRAVFDVKRCINKNYGDEKLSAAMLAEQVHLTPAYLSYLFKRVTGKTIRAHIIEVRIERSKEYLRNADLKLIEVAGKVGYTDPSYYAKVFKKRVGLTPSEYREKYVR